MAPYNRQNRSDNFTDKMAPEEKKGEGWEGMRRYLYVFLPSARARQTINTD